MPNRQYRKLHDRLKHLLHSIQMPSHVYCPAKGKSNINNAMHHIKSESVHNLDITKYFPSTTSGKVYHFFNSVMLCSDDISSHLTNICCYGRHLPTGSPISASLAFWAHYPMWQKIESICIENGCQMSVLMDDITVSSPKVIVPANVVEQIKQAVASVGLLCNQSKEISYKQGETKHITGVALCNGHTQAMPHHYEKLGNLIKLYNQCESDTERGKLNSKIKGLYSYISKAELASST